MQVCVCVCVCVCVVFFNLHVKALLEALVYHILWFDYHVVVMVNVVMFYLVVISEVTN